MGTYERWLKAQYYKPIIINEENMGSLYTPDDAKKMVKILNDWGWDDIKYGPAQPWPDDNEWPARRIFEDDFDKALRLI